MYNASIVLLYKQVYNVITVKETDSRKAERKIAMKIYRVYRVLRDERGDIVHKTPVGGARNERGARAIIAGQWGECIVEIQGK